MAGLVEKDIRILLQRKQNMIMFVILAVVLGYTQEGTFILGYLPLLILILAISTISYDELDNGFTFLLTLPVDIKTYVTEKFIFCGSTGIVSWLLAIVVYYGSRTMHGRNMNLSEDVPMLLAFLVVIVLMMAFSIPVQIRFGANGSRVVMLVVFGVVMILAVILKKMVNAEMLAAIRHAFDRISDVNMVILIVLIVILSLIISYLCSLKSMKKKAL